MLELKTKGIDNAAALQDTLRKIPKSEFAVVLYHSPDLMPEVAAQGIDLFCAGHTHGGQVALPFYGAMITFSKFGKRYGIGMEGWIRAAGPLLVQARINRY